MCMLERIYRERNMVATWSLALLSVRVLVSFAAAAWLSRAGQESVRCDAKREAGRIAIPGELRFCHGLGRGAEAGGLISAARRTARQFRRGPLPTSTKVFRHGHAPNGATQQGVGMTEERSGR